MPTALDEMDRSSFKAFPLWTMPLLSRAILLAGAGPASLLFPSKDPASAQTPPAPYVKSFDGRINDVVLQSSDVLSALTSGTTTILDAGTGQSLVLSSGPSKSILFGNPSYGQGTIASMAFSGPDGGNELVVNGYTRSSYFLSPGATQNVSTTSPLVPVVAISQNYSGTLTGTGSNLLYNSFC